MMLDNSSIYDSVIPIPRFWSQHIVNVSAARCCLPGFLLARWRISTCILALSTLFVKVRSPIPIAIHLQRLVASPIKKLQCGVLELYVTIKQEYF